MELFMDDRAEIHISGKVENNIQKCYRCNIVLIDNNNCASSDGSFSYWKEGIQLIHYGNYWSTNINDLQDQLGGPQNINSYKGFTFKVLDEETVTPGVAKRQYAIAINTNGILTLTGELTYATEDQVLIDELKLVIDSQNLSGYPGNQQVPTPNDEIITKGKAAQQILADYIRNTQQPLIQDIKI